MSRLFRTLALSSAAVLMAATTFAAPQAAGAKPAAKPAAAKKAPKAKSASVVGTLDKYDSGANTITVNTGKGTETLTLSSDSAVRMGAKKMTAADLSSHSGERVKVRYTEANGQRTASSVQIQGQPVAKQAKATASTKPAAKK